MKRVLITGKNSYIGTSLEKWLSREPDKYIVDTLNMENELWIENDFSKYDVVFHVAAVVHKKEKPKLNDFYFKVNRDLPIEVAKKAKEASVSQFVFMSTMAVYGEDGKIGQDVIINRESPVNPKTLYGKSKYEAELELNKLNDDKFRVVVLRPPIVYGPNCPGNYSRLEKLAVRSPIFPMIEIKRSMIHIDKLCQHIKECIDIEAEGLFCPQDDAYVNTSFMVRELALKHGKSIHLSKVAGFIIKLIGKRVKIFNKVFGNLIYEKSEENRGF